jgi:Peroxidase
LTHFLLKCTTGGFSGFGGAGPSGFNGGSFAHPSGAPNFPHPTSAPVPAPVAPTSAAPAPAATSPAAGGSCPQIWFQISTALTSAFTSGATGGQCNDLARGAIRAAFHDCGSWNQTLGTSAGCDGSLFLAKEYTRSENAGLEQVVPQLGAMAQSFGVGVADFFQFAGGKYHNLESTSLI